MKLRTKITNKQGKPINYNEGTLSPRYELVEPAVYPAMLHSVEKVIRRGRDNKLYLNLNVQLHLLNDVKTIIYQNLTVGIVDEHGDLIPSERGDYIWSSAGSFFHAVGAMRPILDETGNFTGEYDLDFDEKGAQGILVMVRTKHESYQKIVDGVSVTRTKNAIAAWFRFDPRYETLEDGFFVDEHNVVWYSQQYYDASVLIREQRDANENGDWV